MRIGIILIILFAFSNITAQVNLDSAYTTDSNELLIKVMKEWSAESKPKDLSQKYDFEKYSYEVFETFYSPKSMTKYNSDWDKSPYLHVKFFLVQNELKVNIFESLKKNGIDSNATRPEPIFSFKLMDFRPVIEDEETEIINLNWIRKTTLGNFLERLGYGSYDLLGESRDAAEIESNKRMLFLNRYLYISEAHFDGWHLETHPFVTSINFNEDFTEASIKFRMYYEGYEARFKRTNGKWKYISSKFLWIE